MPPSTVAKKAKAKKPADPTETSKLLAAKISQLEQDAAGEKDQEAEIGTLLLQICCYSAWKFLPDCALCCSWIEGPVLTFLPAL
jgi:hypothetical protein